MSLYTNIGGGQKQIASLYINKDSSNIALSNAYANINGTNKEIFSATKYCYWRAYPVTKWQLCEYEVDDGTCHYDIRYLKSAYQNSKKVYSSISPTPESDGRMKVLGGVTPSISSIGYYSTTGLMTVDRGLVTPTLTNTGTDYTRETVYKFTNAYFDTGTDNGNTFDQLNISITKAYFVIPRDYNKNAYSTVVIHAPNLNSSYYLNFAHYLPRSFFAPNSLSSSKINVLTYNSSSFDFDSMRFIKFTVSSSDTTSILSSKNINISYARDYYNDTNGYYGTMDTSSYTQDYLPSGGSASSYGIYIFNGYYWIYDGYHA